MALAPCKECKAQIFSAADKCPQCGVSNPCVSYDEEELLREEQRKIDVQVAEILKLGAQKKTAYARLDELHVQRYTGGSLTLTLRALFPSAAIKQINKEFEDTVREIYSLRGRMDQLLDLLPSERRSEVNHLWNYENTTSPFLQRSARNR
jgi:hypothetical protein